MNKKNDDINTPKTLAELIKEDTPERMAERESAYRRGWHQGWAYAVDVIVDGLLEQGVPLAEIRRLVMRFEDERVSPWRDGDTTLYAFNTPVFCLTDYPESVSDEAEHGEDAS